jgi:hypothetical protein
MGSGPWVIWTGALVWNCFTTGLAGGGLSLTFSKLLSVQFQANLMQRASMDPLHRPDYCLCSKRELQGLRLERGGYFSTDSTV